MWKKAKAKQKAKQTNTFHFKNNDDAINNNNKQQQEQAQAHKHIHKNDPVATNDSLVPMTIPASRSMIRHQTSLFRSLMVRTYDRTLRFNERMFSRFVFLASDGTGYPPHTLPLFRYLDIQTKTLTRSLALPLPALSPSSSSCSLTPSFICLSSGYQSINGRIFPLNSMKY